MTTLPWYKVIGDEDIDSPALIIHRDRAKENIQTLIGSIDDINRLRPHIKTHKSAEISTMFIEAGIKKFKCATIAEAEMLAGAGARDVLLAYQPVGPKVKRFTALKKIFPETRFSCLIDNAHSAKDLSDASGPGLENIDYFIDVNAGMNRTGIDPKEILHLFQTIKAFPHLVLRGLHVYDGHIRDADFAIRKTRCDQAFENVRSIAEELARSTTQNLVIVAGGTPTFSVHAKRKDVECSPGTFIYWDKGYEAILPEQTYLHAAVVMARVISKPAPGTICVDLGHKSIASENPLPQRVSFLNAPDLRPLGHSEEHMVLQYSEDFNPEVGDILYGIPYHVCPTIALYERAIVVSENKVVEEWHTRSRDRKITV